MRRYRADTGVLRNLLSNVVDSGNGNASHLELIERIRATEEQRPAVAETHNELRLCRAIIGASVLGLIFWRFTSRYKYDHEFQLAMRYFGGLGALALAPGFFGWSSQVAGSVT